jgi:hypothetical protein
MIVYAFFGILFLSVKKVCHFVLVSTVLARQRDTIGALVASCAVPLAPIAALVTDGAVPRMVLRHYGLPAERIPIALPTIGTAILVQKLSQRHLCLGTRQFVQLFQILLRECFVSVDVLDSADGQAFNIHAIQRILAIGAATLLVTWLVVLETRTAVVRTASSAIAVMFFFHPLLLLAVHRRGDFAPMRFWDIPYRL